MEITSVWHRYHSEAYDQNYTLDLDSYLYMANRGIGIEIKMHKYQHSLIDIGAFKQRTNTTSNSKLKLNLKPFIRQPHLDIFAFRSH